MGFADVVGTSLVRTKSCVFVESRPQLAQALVAHYNAGVLDMSVLYSVEPFL
jgi:hypothetical protein